MLIFQYRHTYTYRRTYIYVYIHTCRYIHAHHKKKLTGELVLLCFEGGGGVHSLPVVVKSLSRLQMMYTQYTH